MHLFIKLANAPFEEAGAKPDWPIIRIDGYLMNPDGSTLVEPMALVQLKGNDRMRGPVPDWKEGDTVSLTPLISCGWNDTQETGRCFVDLYVRAQCEGRAGWVDGLIPFNPNLYDFQQDDTGPQPR